MAAPRAESGSNFRLGFLLLPRAKRDALSAVYAWCRLIDDVVDDGRDKAEARRQLDFWRAEVDRLVAGRPTHEASRALAGPVAEYGIGREPLLEMIRGCAMDLEGTEYRTIEDLESYMRGVASSVGVMCVRIFGWRHTPEDRMLAFARDFGYAFQLTNVIRDVGADLELGRVYLPAADLAEAGYPREKLLRRERAPEFGRLMEREYRRAKDYYARARALVDPRDLRSLAPAEIMGHVYEGLLEKIRADGYPVLFQKTSLSGPRKLALALRGWLRCHGL